MQMAIDVAGFTPAESDELRQAMGSKRSAARMERLRERLYAGMAERGITGEIADELFVKMTAFANYGFPESHSVSFAYLVYASSWIKYHEPAAFCAALLNAQPMGFWRPHTLVRDARRHGVVVRTPDLNASLAAATLEPCADVAPAGSAVRLGIGSVRGIGEELAEEIEAARRPTARTVHRRTSCGGCRRSTSPSWRRWPRPGCSASASGSTGGRRCGRSGAVAAVAAGSPARHRHRRHAPRAARHVAGGGGGRRPVGHRRGARRAPHAVPARRSCDAAGVVTAAGLWDVEPGRGSPSPAWSPIASAR